MKRDEPERERDKCCSLSFVTNRSFFRSRSLGRVGGSKEVGTIKYVSRKYSSMETREASLTFSFTPFPVFPLAVNDCRTACSGEKIFAMVTFPFDKTQQMSRI